jgi:hypothetical protein
MNSFKGIYGGESFLNANLNIENSDDLLVVNPVEKNLNNTTILLFHKPEPGNDIIVSRQTNNDILYHHLQCSSLSVAESKTNKCY